MPSGVSCRMGEYFLALRSARPPASQSLPEPSTALSLICPVNLPDDDLPAPARRAARPLTRRPGSGGAGGRAGRLRPAVLPVNPRLPGGQAAARWPRCGRTPLKSPGTERLDPGARARPGSGDGGGDRRVRVHRRAERRRARRAALRHSARQPGPAGARPGRRWLSSCRPVRLRAGGVLRSLPQPRPVIAAGWTRRPRRSRLRL